jgi:hypothetical protein
MAGTTRGREVYANQIVFDQADFFQLDGYTRVTGLTIANLTVEVFSNNQPVGWNLVAGQPITDAQVVSGRVYFNEIAGQPGYYNIRLRPNAVGFWRVVLSYPSGTQRLAQDYDVLPEAVRQAAGLKPSFTSKCST